MVLQALNRWVEKRPLTVSLGAERDYSVYDMVLAFEQASDRDVPYKIVDRRPEILQHATLTPPWLNASLAGRPNSGLKNV